MNIKELFKDLANRYILKGLATPAQKAHLSALLKELTPEDAAEVKPTADAVEALPEELEAEEAEEAEEKPEVDVEKQVQELVTKELAKHQELGEKRAGVYNEKVVEARKTLNTVVKKFVRALAINDVAVLKDMSTADANGGYTIMTELNAEIQHLVTQYGVARREMYFTFVDGGGIKLNNLATDVTVYWTDEAAAKTSSDVVIGQVELVLKKLAVIVPLTDELLEDTEIDYASFLSERVAEGFAREEDEEFFNGDGTVFTGILNNASVNPVAMTGTGFDDLTADDLIAMVDATPQGALANGKYYMHRSIMSVVRKLKDQNDQYIYQPISATGPATIWGYPVVTVEAMPAIGDSADDTPFVLFGDLRKACWFGAKRAGITVYLAKEGVVRNTAGNADLNLLRQDMTAMRFVERVGFVAVLPNAVTVLSTGALSA